MADFQDSRDPRATLAHDQKTDGDVAFGGKAEQQMGHGVPASGELHRVDALALERAPQQAPAGQTGPARRKVDSRPATGRSFLVIIVLASIASITVALWTLHSLTEAQRARGTPASLGL